MSMSAKSFDEGRIISNLSGVEARNSSIKN